MVNTKLLKLRPEEIHILNMQNREKAFIIPIHRSLRNELVKIETNPNKIVEDVKTTFNEKHKRDFSYNQFLLSDNGLIRSFSYGIGSVGLITEKDGDTINQNMVSFSKEKILEYDPNATIEDDYYWFSTYAYSSKNILGDIGAKFTIEFACSYLNAVIDELDKKNLL